MGYFLIGRFGRKKRSIRNIKRCYARYLSMPKKERIISIDPSEDIIIPSDNNIVVATREHVFKAAADRKKLEEEADKKFSNGVLMYGNNAKEFLAA